MNKWVIRLYLLFLTLFVGFSYLFVDPNFFYLKKLYTGFFTSYREETTILYIIVVMLFFAFYYYFLRGVQKKTISKQNLIFLMVISSAAFIASYPSMLSFDIFNYIATARVTFFYLENPYIVMPIEFLGDTMLLFTHAPNKIALYGPFWIVLSAIPYVLGFGNYLLTIVSFKVFLALFYLGTTILIWKFSRNLFAVAFFALNPLVLIETFTSGHNDIVMAFFALLSFFFILKKKILLSLVFLLLSILIKYATLFLIPVFFYAIWKMYVQKEPLNKEKLFAASAGVMFIAFLLAPIREEIYPWYAMWFLPFIALLPSKKSVQYFMTIFSFCLLLRYTPFMYLGYHYGNTPMLKTAITGIPILLFLIYEGIYKRIVFGKKR